MYSKITDISEADHWRIFSSNLDEFPSNITEKDFFKINNMINQIFNNAFKMEYDFSAHMNYEVFGYEKAVFDMEYKNDQHRKKLSIRTPLEKDSNGGTYSIDFDFIFNKVGDHYVFDYCAFNVKDRYLLAKLPLGEENQNYAHCYSYFLNDKTCHKTNVDYKHSILSNKSKLSFLGTPYLAYKYSIQSDSINLNLVYSYELFGHIKELNLSHVDRNFSINLIDLNFETLLKSQKLHSVFTMLVKKPEQLSDIIELTNEDVHDVNRLENFINNFFDDPFVDDKLTLLEMELI